MRVVVVGGGVAGAELVRCASPSDELELFVIEPKQQIECQALYPEYLSAKVQLEDIVAPLKPFCERMGATLISERALRIEGGEVVCTSTTVAYDVVVIATGAAQNYYGIKGAERAFSINTLEGTLKAREFIERKSPETIVVVGSGLTGVESASGLAEGLEARIYMIEMMDRVLPTFPERTSSKVRDALDEMGVSIITSKSVGEICKESVVLSDGSVLECDMVIWTAGIKPTELVGGLELPKQKGWLLTDPYLRAEGSEDVFAIGDNAWVEVDGKIATKTGIEAERQAKHTAESLTRLARGKPLKRYAIRASTDNQVALISIGCRCAVGIYRNVCIATPSTLIHALKRWIDRSFIKRFK